MSVVRGAIILFAVTLCAIDTAHGAVPTDTEWASWPEFCRARFVVAGDGVGSKYESRVPKSEVAYWESRMGGAWYALHHYCYGLLYEARASSTFDEGRREHNLGNAEREFDFIFDRIANSDPFYGEVASRLSLVYRRQGDLESAYRVADSAIAENAEMPVGYFLKSVLFRSQKRYEEAASVLRTGLQESSVESAELHYALGISLLDLNETDDAALHAKRAYELGYPLQGLRKKLADRGVSLESGE